MSKRQGSTSVRTFIAIELPDAVKTRLGGLSQRFGQAGGAVRWTAPQLLHITLQFLGDVDEQSLPRVLEAARDAAATPSPFRVTVGGIGGFPNPSAPRVIWVGIEPGPGIDALAGLQAAMARELAGRGFPPGDRPFSPHITIGRTRQHVSGADRTSIGQALRSVQAGWTARTDVDVSYVTVMESILGRGGPTYIPRERIALAGT